MPYVFPLWGNIGVDSLFSCTRKEAVLRLEIV